jgi:hypothetical protein
MVIKSRMMWIWAGFLSLGVLSLPCLAGAEGGAPQSPDTKIAEAANKITPALDSILTQVNEDKLPARKELSAGQALVGETKRYFLQMDGKQKAQYCLLQSWLLYYAGQVENASLNAAKACKLDATSADAWATQVAMALLADKKPMLPHPPKPARAQRNRAARGEMETPEMMVDPQEAALQVQKGKLDFDLNSFLAEAIGKKMEPLQLTCLNGTTLSYQPGSESLCVLFWQKFENKKAAASNEPNQKIETNPQPMPMDPMMGYGMVNEGDMSGQASEKTPTAAFGKLFQVGLSSGRVKYLAVNLDAPARKKAVIEEMLKQPQAWAQVVAAGQAVGSFSEFGVISPDKPVLLMADKTGAIRYAGPATGFIAPMLLKNKFLGGELIQLAAPEGFGDTAVNPADSNALSVVDSNSLFPTDSNSVSKPVPAVQTPAPAAAQQTAKPQAKNRELSEEDKVQAEKLVTYAEDVFMKGGGKRVITYKRGVELCRQVIRDYAGSEYAEKARQLLRQVPENQRSRYGITDQELGL